MYAVIQTGGKQYRVTQGQRIKIEKLDVAPGDKVDFKEVLMVGAGDNVEVGAPHLPKGCVTASVVEHGRHKKIKIVKFRRRKHYRRQTGHRQYYTEVQIDKISA